MKKGMRYNQTYREQEIGTSKNNKIQYKMYLNIKKRFTCYREDV